MSVYDVAAVAAAAAAVAVAAISKDCTIVYAVYLTML